MVKPRTSEAQSAIDRLNAELAANSKARGVTLSWSPKELQALETLARTIDRRVEVGALYDKALAAADDQRLVVALSAEPRQLDKLAATTAAAIETDAPQPESLTTQKARAAVNKRWADTREREARNAAR